MSASLFAASTDALALGIDLARWPAQYPPLFVTFKGLNKEFATANGGARALQWSKTTCTAREMLTQTRGTWAAHVYYVEPKDREPNGFRTAYGFDDTPHMVVWQPERRIFFVNPGLVIFTEDESHNVDEMLNILFFEHGIYFAPEHNTTRVRVLTLNPHSSSMQQTNYLFKDSFKVEQVNL